MLTEEEYKLALEFAASLIAVDPAPESVYGRHLVELATLIEEYEREHFPNLFPDLKPSGKVPP